MAERCSVVFRLAEEQPLEEAMTFIRALIPADRWRDWELSVPIYDGRRCPDCGALCVGKRARKAHQGWHQARTEFDTMIVEAIRKTAIGAGLTPRMMAADRSPDGMYEAEGQAAGYVDLRELEAGGDDYDDEEDDER